MVLSGAKWSLAMFTLFLAASLFTACGPAVDPAYHNTAKIAGAWHITIPLQIDTYIVQQGASYSAQNVSASGSCIDGGTMTGSARGDVVTLTFVSRSTPADSISLTGTHHDDLIVEGDVVATGSCTAGSGFLAQRIGSVASDSWSGSLDGSSVVTVKSNLTVDSLGNTSGTLAFSGSSCLTTVDVTGWQLGNELILTDGNPATFLWEGIVNASGRGIAGTYGSACGSGTFTMAR